ncbi:MAG TPA: STM4014 family protein [Steroidobacter sp.]|uniref:STM4014 family protein n=1 Tax=Steroidobacter sp. TaxID=1978227 RepID=UPI002EDAA591
MLLIGNSASRRTALLRAALSCHGGRLDVIEWRDLLSEEDAIDRLLTAPLVARHVWCKIDSPGEDEATTQALIRRGWLLSGTNCVAPSALRHGELAHQQWRFGGFADLLARIQPHLGRLRLLNSVSDILLMCDKLSCQQHLRRRGVPVPELLGEIQSFADLEERFPAKQYAAVFIKSRYGSSAAGVLALRRHHDGRMLAYSSARMDSDGAIYNHLRVSRYERPAEIEALVDALAVQGAYAERWLSKPRAPIAKDASYDLRVVAHCGRARQRVARISCSPMSNLHLGNRRSAPHWLSVGEIDALETATAKAARLFEHSHCIGFDISLRGSHAAVLEANAFGDLLPGLQFEGATTYEDQAALVSADER